ncbi:MAG TPA: Gfo/Idh/MocA family oxidoreductase [Tepidisphaeraceae bacterium]
MALAAGARARAANQSIAWSGAGKDQLNIGIIGTGWRGMDHVREFQPILGARTVALCDTDSYFLAEASKVVPNAATYGNFRDLLKHPRLDAVVVATPDHTHATISATALRAGKHVYCEKPLTHTVHEARAMAKLALETKLVTQMGIQIHATDNYRRVVELIQSNAIGPVHEVHIWNNRNLPKVDAVTAPVPKELDYDLWLGPVAPRPFRPSYHPKWWRNWWAFGSGLLGDIFSHLADVAFWALDLKHPTRIEAEGSALSDERCADWTIVHYDFPARGHLPAVKLHWYDPPKRPEAVESWKLDPKFAAEAIVFIGEKGKLVTNYGEHQLLPAENYRNFKPPAKKLASSRGFQQEWVAACLANDPKMATAPFSYGSLLTEAALLGVVAFKAKKAIEWDAANMRIPNAPEAEKFLKIDYREGWSL